jgi:hypothetical protein
MKPILIIIPVVIIVIIIIVLVVYYTTIYNKNSSITPTPVTPTPIPSVASPSISTPIPAPSITAVVPLVAPSIPAVSPLDSPVYNIIPTVPTNTTNIIPTNITSNDLPTILQPVSENNGPIQLSVSNNDIDCVMSTWSVCDSTGKQIRNVLIPSSGNGQVCGALTQSCIIPSSSTSSSPSTGDYQSCKNSNQCKNSNAYCRVGDHRCLTDSECKYANSVDKKNRDCTRMPRS